MNLFLLNNNQTGGEAILENIVTLVSEGYGIAISQTKVLLDDGETGPGFRVDIFDEHGDGYPVSTATGLVLSEAVADAYEMTPERT